MHNYILFRYDTSQQIRFFFACCFWFWLLWRLPHRPWVAFGLAFNSFHFINSLLRNKFILAGILCASIFQFPLCDFFLRHVCVRVASAAANAAHFAFCGWLTDLNSLGWVGGEWGRDWGWQGLRGKRWRLRQRVSAWVGFHSLFELSWHISLDSVISFTFPSASVFGAWLSQRHGAPADVFVCVLVGWAVHVHTHTDTHIYMSAYLNN